jgi:ATP-binding cassette subfamily B protein
VFGAAYIGAVVFVASGTWRACWPGAAGARAGSRLSAYIGATVGEIGFLRGFWMDGSRRLAWLEDYAASLTANATQPVPERLQRGIRFERVSLRYPGTSRLVLDDCVGLVASGLRSSRSSEKTGAGKSTLVKLLAKMYEPSSGSIVVDDTPLAAVPADAWRARVSGRIPGLLPLRIPCASHRGPR